MRPSVRSAPSTTCAGRPVRLTAQPLPHRQAVWAVLPPAARSRLWVEQLARYRRAHPGLSPEQSDVLEEVHHIAAQESSLAFDRVADPGPAERALREPADRHFGRAEANPLFAAIGPAEPSGRRGAKALNCNCSVESNYCSSSACHDNQCMKGRCNCLVYQRSCGYLWLSLRRLPRLQFLLSLCSGRRRRVSSVGRGAGGRRVPCRDSLPRCAASPWPPRPSL
ncbi:bacteriocin fulvocin C-related protein [Streptomyces sp. NPDC045369]|uniref:bacteriocin fulvocin C-related protein n=1 Tax=Streptomyces sp. NPDC045369 TaxID=3155732 RepID=UPI0033DA89E0